jgi:hypothetical protein
MASVAEQLREYFDDRGVGYRIIAHEAAASADEYHAILGTRYEQMPKAIFLRYQGKDRKGFAILALQAHKRADLQRVRRVLNARDVPLGSRAELREVTGCGFGRGIVRSTTPFRSGSTCRGRALLQRRLAYGIDGGEAACTGGVGATTPLLTRQNPNEERGDSP